MTPLGQALAVLVAVTLSHEADGFTLPGRRRGSKSTFGRVAGELAMASYLENLEPPQASSPWSQSPGSPKQVQKAKVNPQHDRGSYLSALGSPSGPPDWSTMQAARPAQPIQPAPATNSFSSFAPPASAPAPQGAGASYLSSMSPGAVSTTGATRSAQAKPKINPNHGLSSYLGALGSGPAPAVTSFAPAPAPASFAPPPASFAPPPASFAPPPASFAPPPASFAPPPASFGTPPASFAPPATPAFPTPVSAPAPAGTGSYLGNLSTASAVPKSAQRKPGEKPKVNPAFGGSSYLGSMSSPAAAPAWSTPSISAAGQQVAGNTGSYLSNLGGASVPKPQQPLRGAKPKVNPAYQGNSYLGAMSSSGPSPPVPARSFAPAPAPVGPPTAWKTTTPGNLRFGDVKRSARGSIPLAGQAGRSQQQPWKASSAGGMLLDTTKKAPVRGGAPKFGAGPPKSWKSTTPGNMMFDQNKAKAPLKAQATSGSYLSNLSQGPSVRPRRQTAIRGQKPRVNPAYSSNSYLGNMSAGGAAPAWKRTTPGNRLYGENKAFQRGIKPAASPMGSYLDNLSSPSVRNVRGVRGAASNVSARGAAQAWKATTPGNMLFDQTKKAAPRFTPTAHTSGSVIRANEANGAGPSNKVPVDMSAASTWKNLLFSEDFSDVRFVCSDGGKEFPAHQCVLSAASPYFQRYFMGPWKEQDTDGKWVIAISPATMETILSYIYTGALDSINGKSAAQVSDILKVAGDLEIEPLVAACESMMNPQKRAAPVVTTNVSVAGENTRHWTMMSGGPGGGR